MSSDLHIFIFPWLKCHWLWRCTMKNVTPDGPLIRGWSLRSVEEKKKNGWRKNTQACAKQKAGVLCANIEGGEKKTMASAAAMQLLTLCRICCWGWGAGHRGSDSEDGNKRETYDPVQPGRVTVRCVSSVAGILLIIMRLIWHGLNNHLPASDWHSHKKGVSGTRGRAEGGEQMVTFHMTKLINQHAGTQVQRRRAAAHHLFHHLRGTNTWAPIAGTPEARRAPPSRCAKVDDIRISHPLCHGTPREREGGRGGGV